MGGWLYQTPIIAFYAYLVAWKPKWDKTSIERDRSETGFLSFYLPNR